MFLALGVFVVLTAITIILLYFHLTRNFNYWKKQNVPYKKPIPIFGNILKVFCLKQSIGDFTEELYNSTEHPYVGFFVFDQPFLLVRDPELIKLFLIKDFEYFDDRSIIENPRDDEMGSNIMFILKNPAWRRIRVKVSPAFSTGKMKTMLPLMIEATEDLLTYINDVALNEKKTETREMCMKFTTDVISSCAFGVNAHSFKYEDAEFRAASRRIFDWNLSRAVQMACYFFAPVLVHLFKMKFIDPAASKFMKDVFWKMLKDREQTGVRRGDMIDVLIQVRKQNNNMDPDLAGDKLVAQAAQFFIAGFETTGSTISFTLYELAVNPTVQQKLRTEILTVLQKHSQITYDTIQEMKYLDLVVKETLRKYPVLPYLDRRCKKDYVMPGTDVVIKKGMPVYVSLFGLHFDPEYFPDPYKYDPDRFTEENKTTRPTFSYLPFGEGPHNCIGARFGVLGVKIALVQVLRNFEVELCKDTPVPLKFDPKGFLIAPENGLNLHFKKMMTGGLI